MGLLRNLCESIVLNVPKARRKKLSFTGWAHGITNSKKKRRRFNQMPGFGHAGLKLLFHCSHPQFFGTLGEEIPEKLWEDAGHWKPVEGDALTVYEPLMAACSRALLRAPQALAKICRGQEMFRSLVGVPMDERNDEGTHFEIVSELLETSSRLVEQQRKLSARLAVLSLCSSVELKANKLRILDRLELQKLLVENGEELEKQRARTAQITEEYELLEVKLEQVQKELRSLRMARQPQRVESQEAPAFQSVDSVVYGGVIEPAGGDLSAKQFVHKLRESRGMHLLDSENEAVKRVMKSQMRMLQSSLQVIETDIYTNKGRFVFEIVQNSDDCQFGADVEATFRLVITEQGILMSNNETSGFSNRDVESLSSIGDSSKRDQTSTTGKKGIGFKSVFSVSDQCFVYSGDFRLMFDKRVAGGELCPSWTEVDPPTPYFNDGEFTTHFWIPMTRQEALEVKHSVWPFLEARNFFFLRRITSLQVYDTITGQELSISLRRTDQQLFTRTESEGCVTERDYFLFSGLGGSLQLAFPDPSWFGNLSASEKENQSSFAVSTYLPVEDVGFSFAVQGDFILTANRQSIHEDHEESIRLRDQIPHLFALAIESTQVLKEAVHLYLPTARQITKPWWKCILRDLVHGISTLDIVLCRDGELRPPRKVLVASEALLEIVSDDVVLQCLHRYIADPSVSHQAVTEFACEEFAVSHLLQIWDQLADSDWSSPEPVWLSKVYCFLDLNAPLAKVDTELLLKLPIFCLTSGESCRFDDGKVYIYGGSGLPNLGDAVSILHQESTSEPRAHHFLSKLNVGTLSQHEVIDIVLNWHMNLSEKILKVGVAVDQSMIQTAVDHINFLSTVSLDKPTMEQLRNILLIPALNAFDTEVVSPAAPPAAHIMCRPLQAYDSSLRPLFDKYRITNVMCVDQTLFLDWTFVLSLGVNDRLRLIRSSVEGWVLSQELSKFLRQAEWTEIFTEIFERWSYYSRSTSLRAILHSLQPPISGETEAVRCDKEISLSWSQCFLSRGISAMRDVLPCIDVADPKGAQREAFADLGVKFGLLDSNAVGAAQDWLFQIEAPLDAWVRFYTQLHKLNVPFGTSIFFPTERRSECLHVVEELLLLPALLPLSDCVWEGSDAVIRWAPRYQGVCRLSLVYPLSLKPFFCPPIAETYTIAQCVTALRGTVGSGKGADWEFRPKVNFADVAEIFAEVERRLSMGEVFPINARSSLLIPNGKGRFFGRAKAAEGLVVSDYPDLARLLRISLYDQVLPSIAECSRFLEIAGISRISRACSITIRGVLAGNETLTSAYRCAIRHIEKAVGFPPSHSLGDILNVFCGHNLSAVVSFRERKATLSKRPYIWVAEHCSLFISTPKSQRVKPLVNTGAVELIVASRMPYISQEDLSEALEFMGEAVRKRWHQVDGSLTIKLESACNTVGDPSFQGAPSIRSTEQKSGVGGFGSFGFGSFASIEEDNTLRFGGSEWGSQDESGGVFSLLQRLSQGVPLLDILSEWRPVDQSPSSADYMLKLESKFALTIGDEAELIVYESLCRIIQENAFQATVEWSSSAASRKGMLRSALSDDTLGYDLKIVGPEAGGVVIESGKSLGAHLVHADDLLQILSLREVLIEVKGRLTSSAKDPLCFNVSSNEKLKMTQTKHSYCFVVAGLFPRPRFTALICNPARYAQSGELRVKAKDYVFELGGHFEYPRVDVDVDEAISKDKHSTSQLACQPRSQDSAPRPPVEKSDKNRTKNAPRAQGATCAKVNANLKKGKGKRQPKVKAKKPQGKGKKAEDDAKKAEWARIASEKNRKVQMEQNRVKRAAKAAADLKTRQALKQKGTKVKAKGKDKTEPK